MPPTQTQTQLFVWGLVDNKRHSGTPVSSAADAAVVLRATGAWNPPAALAGTPPSAATPRTQQQQLAVGWSHVVWAAADGQQACYLCDTSSWLQASCSKQPTTAADGRVCCPTPPWQLLELKSQHLPQQPQQQQVVVQVAAGDTHCLLLTASGGVWALGSNRYGQVGVPCCSDTSDQLAANSSTAAASQQHPHSDAPPPAPVQQPVLVLGPGAAGSVCQEAVAQVAAGSCHSAAVSAVGHHLYCWGWNAHGQCCVGTTTDVPQPQLCTALDGVPLAAVAAGMAHTVCASRDGAVYACGWNSNGQLGTAQRATGGAGGGGVVGQPGDAPMLSAATTTDSAAGSVEDASTQQPQQQQPQQHQLVGVSSLQPVLVESPELDQAHVVQVACGSRHTRWCARPLARCLPGAGTSTGSAAPMLLVVLMCCSLAGCSCPRRREPVWLQPCTLAAGTAALS